MKLDLQTRAAMYWAPIKSDRQVALGLILLTAVVALLFSEGAITGSDGQTMYQVASSMVEHGRLTVDSTLGVPGRGGLFYSRYGFGLSLIAALAYLPVRPIARRAPLPDRVEQAAAAATMALITGFLVAAVYLLARRLGASVDASVLVAFGTVGGTYVLPYSKEFFSEPLAALCLVVAIERALASRRGGAGLALGAAGLTRPQAFALAPVLMWSAWNQTRWRGALRVALGLAPGALAAGAYNYARFGSFLRFGYEDVGFSASFLTGTAELLVHPAKSVFLFAPVIVVLPVALGGLYKRSPTAFLLLTLNFGITFAIAATWVSWAGGWCWGPRLLIIGVVPALAAVAPWCDRSAGRKRVVAWLYLVGLMVSAPAMIVSTRAQQLDRPPPSVGPSVIRQYELIGPTATYTSQHLYEYEKGTNLRFLSLWQVGASRVLGKQGLLLAVILTALEAICGVAFAHRLRKNLESAPT